MARLKRLPYIFASSANNAVRSMLHTCVLHATQYSFLFNANKSKCIRCHPIGMFKLALRTFCYPSFIIGLQSIDFSKKLPYLWHIISHDCNDYDDLCAKKTSLIGQVKKYLYFLQR